LIQIAQNFKTDKLLGIVLARKGDLDAAIRLFQEALRLNPNDIKARENLGIALEQKRMQSVSKP
jgi:Flp pilus assembly protein TadD